MLEATCPLFGLASPASTAERSVKKAAPRHIRRLVRTPADLRLYSRSSPMTPPRTDAATSRGTAPLNTTTCWNQLKSNGAEMEANVVLMALTLADAIIGPTPRRQAGYRRRKLHLVSVREP